MCVCVCEWVCMCVREREREWVSEWVSEWFKVHSWPGHLLQLMQTLWSRLDATPPRWQHLRDVWMLQLLHPYIHMYMWHRRGIAEENLDYACRRTWTRPWLDYSDLKQTVQLCQNRKGVNSEETLVVCCNSNALIFKIKLKHNKSKGLKCNSITYLVPSLCHRYATLLHNFVNMQVTCLRA